MAIDAQGLGRPRPAPGQGSPAAQLRRAMDRLGTIQLDAVNTVARTQFLVAWSRVGPYRPRRRPANGGGAITGRGRAKEPAQALAVPRMAAISWA